MSHLSVDQVLDAIRAEMQLSKEAEHEILAEVRTHLEDAWEAALQRGEEPDEALLNIATRFGGDEVGQALQAVHLPWQSADAIIACALPVLLALVLRWLIYAPDGTMLGWEAVLLRPAFWIVSLVALLVPLLCFQRWRIALLGWGFFWGLTILFFVLPTIQRW